MPFISNLYIIFKDIRNNSLPYGRLTTYTLGYKSMSVILAGKDRS